MVPPEVKETSNKVLPLALRIVTQLISLFPVTKADRKVLPFSRGQKKIPGFMWPLIETKDEKERKWSLRPIHT